MRISFYIPKGKKDVVNFLNKEISATRNIKDRVLAESIALGLSKFIKSYDGSGQMMFFDTKELELGCFSYSGNISLYRCDKYFISSPIDDLINKRHYLLITMDADECTIGEIRGKSINILFNEKSSVPRKQGSGGQSQKRFMENRRLALLQWKKKIGKVLSELYNDY